MRRKPPVFTSSAAESTKTYRPCSSLLTARLQWAAKLFKMFAAGDALDYEVSSPRPDTVELNVAGRRYAKFYQEIGAPELGFLLTCSADFTYVEGFGGDVQVTRTQTIMQGADHCDFRFKLTQKEAE